MMNPSKVSTRGDVPLDALVADVVDEFRDRLKRGEQPDIEEYAKRHPEVAPLLRKVLASLQWLDASAPEGSGVNKFAPDAPLTGTLGDFRLIREVGRGGMGIVYEAEQISLGRRVALKVLPFAATLDPRQLQRFHNEARAAASLHHEHIVPVFAVGQERGIHFFAMQFIEGQTLAQIIQQQKQPATMAAHDAPTMGTPAAPTVPIPGKSSESPPSDAAHFQRIAEWGIQAAMALEHAHTLGIVHRDIKPGNLMIDPQAQLWIADFGLARRAADPNLTMSGDLLGTLRYMSPEQALAKHDLVDHRSDIYSLGATLYELLTLQFAVEGKDRAEIIHNITQTDAKSLQQWNRRIPADLETIVLKALSKEPETRYGTAKEIGDDLQRYMKHEPIRARRPTLRQRLGKWGQRNRTAVLGAMSVAVFALACMAAITLLVLNHNLELEDNNKKLQISRADEKRQRERAEARTRLARKAVKEMYTEVAEKLLSEIPGTGGVRRDFLQKALVFNEEFAREENSDPADRLEAAWANVRVGSILYKLAQLERSGESYRRAVILAERLLIEQPANPDCRELIANACQDLSWVLDRQGRPDEAVSTRKRALALYEKLASEYPNQLSYRRAYTHTCSRMAFILWKVRSKDAEPLARKALQLAERLIEDHPDDPHLVSEIFIACHDLGLCVSNRQEAESVLARGLAICETLAQKFPGNQGYRDHVGFLSIHLANAQIANGHKLEAKTNFQKGFLWFRRMVTDYPEQAHPHEYAALALLSLAGNVSDAAEARQLVADMKEMAQLAGSAAELRSVYATAWSRLGYAFGAKRYLPEAIIALEEAIRLKPADPSKQFMEANRISEYRFRAASNAVSASAKEHQADGNDSSRMRKQAHDWLNADVDFWRTQLQGMRHDQVLKLANTLSQWQNSRDLTYVREEQHVAKLPETERKSWQKLWADVTQLRKQADDRFRLITRVTGSISPKEHESFVDVKLQAGSVYFIDLESESFDTFLHLHDVAGKILAKNDDFEPGTLNSRLIFTPNQNGVYRIKASAFQCKGSGLYTLTIREFTK